MGRKKDRGEWVNDLPPPQRLAEAIVRIDRVLNATIALIHLHVSNRLVLYGDTIHTQIPLSFAGITYRVVTNALENEEILRICRIWDPQDRDRNSLPAIAHLLSDHDVCKLALDARLCESPWRSEKINAEHVDALNALEKINRLRRSPLVKNLKRYRDFSIAHYITQDSKPEAQNLARRGDERRLLEETIKILSALNLAIRGADFAWVDCWAYADECAKELWANCKFTIPDHAQSQSE